MNSAIAFFAYNRSDYIERIFQAINQQNLISDVYCFIDLNADNPAIQKVLESCIVNACRPDLNLTIVLRDKNMGSGGNLNNGLDYVFTRHDSCIILEDDCIPEKPFFTYMWEMLNRYKDDARVGVVTGSNYASNFISEYKYDIVFSRSYILWGWAIWKDRWQKYRSYDRNNYLTHLKDGAIWVNLPKISRHYMMASFYKYFNSDFAWDVPLLMYCSLTNRLCLYPHKNLVENAGIGDGQGVHTTAPYKRLAAAAEYSVEKIPDDVYLNSLYEDLLSLFSAKSNGGAIPIGIPTAYLGVWSSM